MGDSYITNSIIYDHQSYIHKDNNVYYSQNSIYTNLNVRFNLVDERLYYLNNDPGAVIQNGHIHDVSHPYSNNASNYNSYFSYSHIDTIQDYSLNGSLIDITDCCVFDNNLNYLEMHSNQDGYNSILYNYTCDSSSSFTLSTPTSAAAADVSSQ